MDDEVALIQTQVGLTERGRKENNAAQIDDEENEAFDAPPAKKAAKKAPKKATKHASTHHGPTMFTAAAAEFIAMTLFVFIGCGSAMAVAKVDGYAWVLQVSLTFGLAIAVLAYTIGHYSGAQINCAVTFGLAVSGHLDWLQALANFAAQLLGALLGSFLTKLMFSKASDKTGGLGTNAVQEGYEWYQALLGEFIGTFLLMFVVLEVAIDKGTAANRAMSALVIGFAVFLAHSVLVPVDGCSINPTRSFGPAVIRAVFYKEIDAKGQREVGFLKEMWIFWVGPLAGAASAAGVYLAFQ